MPWRVEYHETQGIVELTHCGETSASDVHDAAVEAIAVAKEHDVTLGLVNCQEQTSTGSPLDLVELPELYDRAGLSRLTRIAFVRPQDPKLKGLADFYEMVCVNRGWLLHTCPTREFAFDWLLDNAVT